ncbi:hypothetical protein QH494_17500 [Sphingomonas sp. AR_OL41]|uniref:hypothetical protein n=1 Tax=Sphingomonas sp. AR_OL41 TaxID=3042729 RepID=UPI002480355D|nr:hypothetical protein [Sphingomonas sp. AR_OL41]MDH7973986.1 hypothetical protein [Sphingomonas sp. AR_OL41]
MTMTVTTTEKVQKESATLKRLFGWLFGIGAFLIFSEIAYMPLKAVILTAGTAAGRGAVDDLAETILASLPALALLGAVWQARRVFGGFAGGEILSVEAGKALTRLGDWLVASTVLSIFFGPAGGRADIVFGLNLSAIIMLGSVGLAIRLIGRVVEMAAAIKSDHDQIV